MKNNPKCIYCGLLESTCFATEKECVSSDGKHGFKPIVNQPKSYCKPFADGAIEEFNELLSHYKHTSESTNRAINGMRRKPNSVLEDEIKAFILSVLERQAVEMKDSIKKKVRPPTGLVSDCDPWEAGHDAGIENSIEIVEEIGGIKGK